jgi:hypothetical protein
MLIVKGGGGFARCSRKRGNVHVCGDDLLGERDSPIGMRGFGDCNVLHAASALAVQVLQLWVNDSANRVLPAAAAAAVVDE